MRSRTFSAALLLLASSVIAQSPKETVLFPFDDNAIPFNKGVLLTLIPGEKAKPVLTPGPAGSPDDRRVYFAGTIIKIGDEYRMWYAGYDKAATRHACYAVSKDGIKWERPSLGLVDYNGSTANNLVSIDGGELKSALFLVLHDPEDPDPAKRFKMLRERDPENSIKAAFSPDGLRWTSAAGDKFVIAGEPSGLVKYDGLYYVKSVTHKIKRGEYKQSFELSRNGLISTIPRVAA